jgi:hypothetical protein
MPSSMGASGNNDSTRKGYERNNVAGSRSDLATVSGGFAHNSSGHWNRLGGSAIRGPDCIYDFDDIGDIEMEPRGKITGIVIANHRIPEANQGPSASQASTTHPRAEVTVTGSKCNESNESLLAAHGITCTQTVDVQWTTHNVNETNAQAVAIKGTGK